MKFWVCLGLLWWDCLLNVELYFPFLIFFKNLFEVKTKKCKNHGLPCFSCFWPQSSRPCSWNCMELGRPRKSEPNSKITNSFESIPLLYILLSMYCLYNSSYQKWYDLYHIHLIFFLSFIYIFIYFLKLGCWCMCAWFLTGCSNHLVSCTWATPWGKALYKCCWYPVECWTSCCAAYYHGSFIPMWFSALIELIKMPNNGCKLFLNLSLLKIKIKKNSLIYT